MTYATLDHLRDRFGEQMLVQLTDRAFPPTGAIGVEVVARALTDTDAVINGSLAKRYRLPLGEVPDLVADLALTIAIYKLHVFAPDQKIKEDYEGALRTLRDVSTGVVVLDLAGIEPTSSGAGGVVATDRDRPLTSETLRGFI